MMELTPNYKTLLKSLMRPEKATPAQAEVARKSCTWLTDQIATIRNFCYPDELGPIGVIFDHWVTHHEAPSHSIVKHAIVQSKDPRLQSTWEDYEAGSTDTVVIEPEDLPALWQHKVHDFKTTQTLKLLAGAAIIAKDGQDIAVKGNKKVRYQGPDDAIRFVFEKADAGVIGGLPDRPNHGSLQDARWAWDKIYPNAEDEAGKQVMTGIGELDKQVRMRAGMLVGILGYAKAGKSRLGRTIAYRAAAAGLSVIHVTTEMSREEELGLYGVIHAHEMDRRDGTNHAAEITQTRVALGKLTPRDREYLCKVVGRDLEAGGLPGILDVWGGDPGETWSTLQTRLITAAATRPVDVIYIDYLQALRIDPRREREETDAMVAQAQELARTYAGGRGVLVISPLQANRAGHAKAKVEGGKFELDSVFQHSSYDKYCSLILTVFQDDTLKASGHVSIGTAAYRFGPGIVSPVRVAVHAATQLLGGRVREDAMSEFLDCPRLLEDL